ncbi:hypothetical protein GE061_001658 [Apolygus lucorum]|uniref:Uncharacterized protein n=1 Tax=Apolygus lucorum TaxID=248454 RepID=A0A8S9Y9J1_APOLU|nr:hypothetical protein GE061_001658 [Apolygus lucorum]
MAGSNPTPTIKQFDGKNFGNWEFRVHLVLEQNSVLDAIDCEMPVVNEGIPGSKKALEDWMRMDVKARGIIVDRVDDSILVMVKDKPTAKDMIESLKKTYLKTGMVSRIQIQKRWRRMEFKGDKPLHEFFVEFGNVCSDLRVAGGKVDDAEIIIQLLVAMPEEYDNVVSAIDIAFNDGIEGKLSSSITLDYVKNRLLAEEDRLRRRGGHDDLEEAGPTQLDLRTWEMMRRRGGNPHLQRLSIQSRRQSLYRTKISSVTVTIQPEKNLLVNRSVDLSVRLAHQEASIRVFLPKRFNDVLTEDEIQKYNNKVIRSVNLIYRGLVNRQHDLQFMASSSKQCSVCGANFVTVRACQLHESSCTRASPQERSPSPASPSMWVTNNEFSTRSTDEEEYSDPMNKTYAVMPSSRESPPRKKMKTYSPSPTLLVLLLCRRIPIPFSLIPSSASTTSISVR